MLQVFRSLGDALDLDLPTAQWLAGARVIDRITYNFPQGRITDHRINLTLYKIQSMMDGDINELTGALIAENQAQMLAELGENF